MKSRPVFPRALPIYSLHPRLEPSRGGATAPMHAIDNYFPYGGVVHATCKYLKSERLGEDDVGRAELAVAVGLDGKHDVLRQPHARGRHVELAVAEARPLEVHAHARERLTLRLVLRPSSRRMAAMPDEATASTMWPSARSASRMVLKV